MARLGSPVRDRRSAALLVAILAAAVYANSLENQFAYDDQHIVVDNRAIQSIETLPDALLRPYWPYQYGQELGLWRPVTTAALGLQYIAGSGSPLVFHVVNVTAHVAVSLLVLVLLLELMPVAAALAGAALFAVHPVHVEAVANVVGFAELASAIAVLSACVLHLRGGPSTGWGRAGVLGLLYAMGFGAKESAVTLPGLIFLLDAVRERIGFADLRRYASRRWRLYVVMALVAAALLLARYAVLGSIARPLAPLGGSLLYEIPRIWTLGDVWLHYVRLWVFPIDLAADYSPNVIPISLGWRPESVVGVSLALLILGLALHAWRRPSMGPGWHTAKAASFGALWFLIAISPISNTIFVSGVLLAERTLYLPSAGLAAATGWLVVRIAQNRRRVAWTGLVVMITLGSIRTWTRNPDWYDNERVVTVMLRDYPQSGRSQWILGDLFTMQGRVSEGLRSYRVAINLLGTQYQLLTDISKRMMMVQHYHAAEALLRYASEEMPQFPAAFGLLALVKAEQGHAPDTEHYARISLGIEDRDPTRHYLLAWALAAQGQFEEASEAAARGSEQGTVAIWQRHMYDAYAHRAAGDSAAALAAVDSAWQRTFTDIGRRALDSVRVSQFGLEPYLERLVPEAEGRPVH